MFTLKTLVVVMLLIMPIGLISQVDSTSAGVDSVVVYVPHLPDRPDRPQKEWWSYLIPRLSYSQGEGVSVGVDLGSIMEAREATRRQKYEDELKKWEEAREARADSLSSVLEMFEYQVLLLDLEKAEYEQRYTASVLRIAKARFTRDEITDEQLLSAERSAWLAEWTVRQLHIRLEQLRVKMDL